MSPIRVAPQPAARRPSPARSCAALALGLAACSPNIGSMGGPPMLGTTGGDTSGESAGATASATVDETGVPIPEGPRRRRIDLDPALVADVGGTTLLVVIGPEDIEYEDAQPDGSDLRMRGPGDDGPYYPIEIEQWSPGGRSYVWVRIDATPLPESLWMYYAEDQGFPAIEPQAVWDGAFAAVWHMARGEASRVTDSTAGGNDLQPVGFTGYFDEGIVGPATFFVPPAMPVDAGPLELPDAQALALGDAFTIEAWVWPATATTESTSHVLRKTGAFELHALEPTNTRPRLELRTTDGSGPHVVEAGASLSAMQWTYVAVTYQASDGMLALYRNGELEDSLLVGGDAEGRAVATTDTVVQMGRNLNGLLDEVRVSSIARSAAWIRLQHAAMIDELLTIGPPQAQP